MPTRLTHWLPVLLSLAAGAAPAAGPAQALQRAQIDMLQSNTFRAHPDYWGAYFVTGNQQ